MKILFINNFSLMNSIKEEFLLLVMWTVTALLVSSMSVTTFSNNIYISPGHCLLDGLYKHYLGVWQVGRGSHIAYLLGEV